MMLRLSPSLQVRHEMYDILQVEENTSESSLALKKHVESPDSPNGKPNNIPSILAHPTGNTKLTDSWQQQI
ncbi:hypothetical protein M8J75_002952 [Diaphorina citri]|nr:hypothetical protein M8J75_002952 [Diaphorina citri]